MRKHSEHRRRMLAGLLCAASLAFGSPAVAQSDTVRVVAGAEYAAGSLRRALLGHDYRDLWTTPIQVLTLDLDRFAGGLRPMRRGGGEQTRSLRLRGADGREYSFRSVNKYPSLVDEPALEGTVVARAIQDQVSSLHPAAALVAAPLLDAAGVLHVTPTLWVMPDDPRLGEFRAEFAGMLGTLEERPDEDAGSSEIGRFPRIIGTERLLERLEESPTDRVDSRAYLRARLMDVWLGDWDRHADQWRWAEDRRSEISYWIAVPRDRDYAFADYDGLLLRVARAVSPNAVRFGPDLRNVRGLTLNAQELDRRLLQDLPLTAFDSVAADLRARLSDAVIEAAVRRMPAEYQPRSAAGLAADLRMRRDQLSNAARRFYAGLATEVDIRATDQRDSLVVERVGEDALEVRLFTPGGSAEPFYFRRFTAPETNEVRIFLHGGDDHAVVRGDVRESLMVRVIGGGGDDVLVDSSAVRGDRWETAFYDDRGDNRLVRGRQTVVDRREYQPPPRTRDISGQGHRDWGSSRSIEPFLDYRGTEGLVVGGGPSYTRYGFRKTPYSYRVTARGMVGLGSGGLGADVLADLRRAGSAAGSRFYLRGSQLESIRFFGYGNDTELRAPSGRYTIPQDQILGTAALTLDVAGLLLSGGPVVKYTNPDVPDDHPVGVLPPYGSGGFGQVGAHAELRLDRRDRSSLPRRGVHVAAGASGYPALWDLPTSFGEAHAVASTYLPVPVGREATLALRAGGQKVWGDFPVHEAAFLGGSQSLRGYAYQRFAGDAAIFGNAELRAPIAPAKILLRGDLGALLMADIGRVYLNGDSPGGWHRAVGVGLWMSFRIREGLNSVSVTYARGEEEGRVYLKLGMPF